MREDMNVTDSQCMKLQEIYRKKQEGYNKWVKANEKPEVLPKITFWQKIYNFFFD